MISQACSTSNHKLHSQHALPTDTLPIMGCLFPSILPDSFNHFSFVFLHLIHAAFRLLLPPPLHNNVLLKCAGVNSICQRLMGSNCIEAINRLTK